MFTLRGLMLRLNGSSKGPLRRVFGGSAVMCTNSSDTAFNYNLTTSTVVQFSAIKTPANTDDITVDLANNRFIANRPGRYLAFFTLPQFSQSFRATLEGIIYVNGTIASSRSFSYIRAAVESNNRSVVDGSSILQLNQGDLVTVQVIRTEDVDNNTNGPINMLENATFGILKVDD